MGCLNINTNYMTFKNLLESLNIRLGCPKSQMLAIKSKRWTYK